MNTSVVEVPVLIVGGGPAGLTASLLLSRLGVSSCLIDKRAGGSPLPRARGVHARAMEIMRGTGVEPDLRRVELEITPGAQFQANLASPPVREDVPGAADESGASPCQGLSVSQDVFESVLREHARGYQAAELRTGSLLEHFEVADAGVAATVADRSSGRRSRIRARWMIAADGARSGIRERLGIGLAGAADLGRQWMVAFRADLSGYTGKRPRGMYFLTDTGAALIWTHADHRWVIRLPDAPGERDPGTTARQVLGIPGLPVEVLGASHWTAAAQSAERYSQGPVFLAGDAAHQVPPAGATGVSAAMHDAHNLAWKLAAVWRGRAGPGLLDSYAVEREAVGRRNADETGVAWARLFSSDGPPFSGRSLAQIDMGYQYKSAVITSDGSPDQDPPTGPPRSPAAGPRTCGWTAALPRPSTCSATNSCCSPPSPAPPGGLPVPPRRRHSHYRSTVTSSPIPNGRTAMASRGPERYSSAPTATSPGAPAPPRRPAGPPRTSRCSPRCGTAPPATAPERLHSGRTDSSGFTMATGAVSPPNVSSRL
jgi:tetracenomycin A2 monooxygenase-dioxygenase